VVVVAVCPQACWVSQVGHVECIEMVWPSLYGAKKVVVAVHGLAG
jgi:hypothetical protein